VSVVHNGIIENHEEMRKRLRAKGYEFLSDTDTEVIAHLVHSNVQSGAKLFDAVKKSVVELVGAYAIAVVSESDPSRLVVARHGARCSWTGQRRDFAASDTSASSSDAADHLSRGRRLRRRSSSPACASPTRRATRSSGRCI